MVTAHCAGTASTSHALPNAARQGIVTASLGSVYVIVGITMVRHAKSRAVMRRTTQIGAAAWTSGAGLYASLVG